MRGASDPRQWPLARLINVVEQMLYEGKSEKDIQQMRWKIYAPPKGQRAPRLKAADAEALLRQIAAEDAEWR